PETLRELVGDDPAIIRQLLQSYLDASRGYADELQTANTADDITVVGAIAHKLKSASRAVGALSLGDLCADLENAAKSGDMQDVQAKVPEFMATFDAVDKALEQLVQQD
ncbi:MAG TPA: Hpt domain-containing protein, partial [Gammaproteobacteria bacterium]|nr:Hpt domain-containing protein [Gammaproteobacteria bacterium]